IADIATVIAVDANPVHFAATDNFLFADNRYVVFSLAGDGTSVATDTGVQVNCHRPCGNRIACVAFLLLTVDRYTIGVYTLAIGRPHRWHQVRMLVMRFGRFAVLAALGGFGKIGFSSVLGVIGVIAAVRAFGRRAVTFIGRRTVAGS